MVNFTPDLWRSGFGYHTQYRRTLQSDDADAEDMAARLEQLCARCELRAGGERAARAYETTARDERDERDDALAACRVCLGVLQPRALRAAAAEVLRLAAAVRHDGRYKLAVHLPLSVALLRDRVFRQTAAAAAATVNPLSVRDALRLSIAPLLRALGRFCPDAPLLVTLKYDARCCASDAAFLPHLERAALPAAKRPRTPVPSITAAQKLLLELSDHEFAVAAQHLFPLPRVEHPVSIAASVASVPVLLAARYTKLSRVLSQTPWNVLRAAGNARVATSVQAAVERALRKHLLYQKATFTAGGREDVDVRMLGGGRPFIVQLHQSAVVPCLISQRLLDHVAAELQHHVVRLHHLRVVDASYVHKMREYEADKQKHYRCVVYTTGILDQQALRKLQLRDLQLMQKTPLRVLHRRTQMTRPKRIARVDVVRLINPHFVVLDVVAQAGTYIKEFVHGDNGRTTPSIASLLHCFVDIVQLDVTDISHTS
ncbi:putative tRNA pseudouridine synthase Pus10 [Gracilariopsis chorda]|uniref:tRNA pseudouridine(55) synthase n=1 Tax=Gracilariopsis chorda TaxID=448386 RepID=A0A2V3IIS9_9FLOR|nr:putative tRNA pseudouridine synthase Pus10 [Gracilariopsis chorda]|eukprot:PXF41987.1 putative tRNA pseudouridine synthase Pus10 [Gracilariopsis chorda]